MEHFHFEDGLRLLKTRLLAMAALVEERVQLAIQALVDRRAELADRVIAGDVEINDLQIEIDDRCLTILALLNPKATDLRTIAAAMKINADLERIGDQAVNIAEHALKLVRLPVLKPLIDIPRMAEMAAAMTRDSLDAFARRDAALARRVLAQRRRGGRAEGSAVPGTADLHDGRPGDHRAGPGAAAGQPVPRANCRSRDEHR